MFFIKIKVFICFLLLLSGCEFSKYQSTNLKYTHNINIETPNKNQGRQDPQLSQSQN